MPYAAIILIILGALLCFIKGSGTEIVRTEYRTRGDYSNAITEEERMSDFAWFRLFGWIMIAVGIWIIIGQISSKNEINLPIWIRILASIVIPSIILALGRNKEHEDYKKKAKADVKLQVINFLSNFDKFDHIEDDKEFVSEFKELCDNYSNECIRIAINAVQAVSNKKDLILILRDKNARYQAIKLFNN